MSRLVRIFLLVLLLSLLLVPGFGCSSSSPPAGGGLQLEVTDQLGRVVSLQEVPQRIVSLDPANTEILFALGLADRVVGVTDDSDYPDEAKTKETVGSYSSPDTAKVQRLHPDLVVASALHQEKVIPALEKEGITVLALDPKSIDGVLAAIALVGEATQKNSEASQLVAGLEARVKAVTDQTGGVPDGERPGILYVIWYDPLYTAGSGTLETDIIQKAGGTNIAQDFVKEYGEWSWQTAVEVNPDVILVAINFGLGTSYDAAYQFVTSDSSLQGTDAVSSERVYIIWDVLVGRPGPRVVDGLEELAMLLQLPPSTPSS